MKNGGCPTCHRYFIVFYVLREKGLIDLVVTTFLPENPPKEVLEISNGKHYPLVKVHKGVDQNGLDMTGIECDTVDEIEKLLERFDCEDTASSKESKAEATAEKSFEDLYKKFMVFLKDPKNNQTPLIKCLEKVDAHLRDTNQTFMIKDVLTRADCYLLPSLQHIRVAGKAYKDFEIPTELRYIWRYLQNAYDTDAFRESCPADREIITIYDSKASCRAKLPVRRSQLMGESRTFSIPVEATNVN